MMRLVAPLALLLVLTVACGDDDTTTATAPEGTASTTQAIGDDSSSSTTAPSTTTVTEPAAPPMFDGLGGEVVLVTPRDGEGTRPLLAWDPVPDAASYTVYLYSPSGAVYWSWAGAETSIHVGGEPQLREGAPGPSVTDGMSWAVIAWDADLLPVAVSELRPIAP